MKGKRRGREFSLDGVEMDGHDKAPTSGHQKDSALEEKIKALEEAMQEKMKSVQESFMQELSELRRDAESSQTSLSARQANTSPDAPRVLSDVVHL